MDIWSWYLLLSEFLVWAVKVSWAVSWRNGPNRNSMFSGRASLSESPPISARVYVNGSNCNSAMPHTYMENWWNAAILYTIPSLRSFAPRYSFPHEPRRLWLLDNLQVHHRNVPCFYCATAASLLNCDLGKEVDLVYFFLMCACYWS
jgi:hypothetical protein